MVALSLSFIYMPTGELHQLRIVLSAFVTALP
jgi:hypothetical protein